MAESLSAVLSLRSKYPACQFKAFDIWSEYLCFHIFITVIKCGTEMDGVCTTSCMAYKSMLEFPVNLVCMFFWTVGAEDLEKAPQGGEHATSTWRIEPEGLATVLIATPLFCGHTGPSGAGGRGGSYATSWVDGTTIAALLARSPTGPSTAATGSLSIQPVTLYSSDQ